VEVEIEHSYLTVELVVAFKAHGGAEDEERLKEPSLVLRSHDNI